MDISIESIKCIFLSSLALNAISLTFSLNTMCLLFEIFPMILILVYHFMNSLGFPLRLSASSLFFLGSFFYFQFDWLLNNFVNLRM